MGRTRTTHGDQNEALMEHNPPSPVGSWPAIPPSPLGPMSTAREPSLEFCSEPELMEQSNEILMEASETREIVGDCGSKMGLSKKREPSNPQTY